MKTVEIFTLVRHTMSQSGAGWEPTGEPVPLAATDDPKLAAAMVRAMGRAGVVAEPGQSLQVEAILASVEN